MSSVSCSQVPLATPAVEVALKSPLNLMPSPVFVTVQVNVGAEPAASAGVIVPFATPTRVHLPELAVPP